ncbi:uncharacterized protein [Medicago truncatula]|uniref:uncharacterized protein n=1 Tax=Medicago truncatula TaxID=3880 RepID=UPI0019679904|nr:uncharacterized protein LOC112418686 [Medicago truncatula]
MNLMFLNNETWSLYYLVSNIYIYNSVDTIISAFKNDDAAISEDRYVKWNCNNHMGTILNVDGSCNGTPIRTSFGGVFRNNGGLFLSAFSCMISQSEDILLAELTTIYHRLCMAIDMGVDDLACYSNSLLSINLIKGDTPHYHVYVVLIQNIKDILATNNFTFHHTLRDGNQNFDFMAKLGATSNADFVIHTTPPEDLILLLRSDASGVFFPRAFPFFFFLLSSDFSLDNRCSRCLEHSQQAWWIPTSQCPNPFAFACLFPLQIQF